MTSTTAIPLIISLSTVRNQERKRLKFSSSWLKYGICRHLVVALAFVFRQRDKTIFLQEIQRPLLKTNLKLEKTQRKIKVKLTSPLLVVRVDIRSTVAQLAWLLIPDNLCGHLALKHQIKAIIYGCGHRTGVTLRHGWCPRWNFLIYNIGMKLNLHCRVLASCCVTMLTSGSCKGRSRTMLNVCF